jgi:hypothetical protein
MEQRCHLSFIENCDGGGFIDGGGKLKDGLVSDISIYHLI